MAIIVIRMNAMSMDGIIHGLQQWTVPEYFLKAERGVAIMWSHMVWEMYWPIISIWASMVLISIIISVILKVKVQGCRYDT